MVKKGYTPEQIINKLREAEILLNQGATIAAVSKKIGLSDHTYYRWRRDYGGMRVDQVRRLKELEQEKRYNSGIFNAVGRQAYIKSGHIMSICDSIDLFVCQARLNQS